MKKTLSLLLILAALLPTFTACADNSGEAAVNDTPSAQSDTANTSSAKEEETRYTANIPEGTDYDGKSFTVLAYPVEVFVWGDVDWNAEEMTGEAINDAVYTRTLNTESKLNVDIKVEHMDAYGNSTAIQQSVTAQDNAYQLATNNLMAVFTMSQSGLLSELNNYAAQGSLDLGAAWWDQNCINDLSIAHKNYMLTGDIGTMYKKSIGAIMFNKAILGDYQIEDPYALMESGKWTVDKMVEMGAMVSDDLNGDGVMDTNDRYGLICFCDMMGLAFIGCGVEMAAKDENDVPSVTLYSEKAVSVVDKLATLMYDENLSWSWSKAGLTEETAFSMYQQDQSLFYYGELHSVATMRSMDSPFGVLPMPKYDETQANYYHCVNPHVASVYFIPITNVEYTMTGHVMDTLGAESKNELTPAYYDVTLIGKVSRDAESAASLDIIIGSIRYDIGYLSGIGISSMLNTMANSFNTDLASQYQKQAKVFDKLLTRIVDTFVEG
ncbi:MAG: hypothetical protein IJP32_05995 [Clostridia bacterium]|nr:hypothetical protein [Clostridia bacterium]MBQ9995904.1 hypothetical protein [Clostridia bacterium]